MAKNIINKEEFAFLESLKRIVRSARGMAYASINYAQVQANWLLGQRIVEQMQKGNERAEYGAYIVKIASEAFVLVDLKVGKISHQDVGQMDMYVRMYDELKRSEGDNPTIGILLCAQTDRDIARNSVLKGNEQIFASKYKLLLPSEEELANEISRQKEIFQLKFQK